MTTEEAISVLDDAKNLLDSVYCNYGDAHPYTNNRLITIDLIIKELISEIEGE